MSKTSKYIELLNCYGSPLYVYDVECVSARVHELQCRLPAKAKIFYSLKSNPLPAIAERVVREGCFLEVTSENELMVAINTSISPHNVLYGGPGKTEKEFHCALQKGVSCFSIESWVDLERLVRVAGKRAAQARILFRVNPDEALSSGLSMSGAATQFGFEEQLLIKGWENVRRLGATISVLGFHVYYGTQMKSSDAILQAAQAAINCIDRICHAVDYWPQVINLGGGFPWAYASPQSQTTLEDLSSISELAENSQYCRSAELWFESGRYLSASSGVLLTTVLDIKESKDKACFVVLDAGINVLGGMSGIGRLPRGYIFLSHLKSSQPVFSDQSVQNDLSNVSHAFSSLSSSSSSATQSECQIAVKRTTAGHSTAVIVGPLCSPLDCMNRKHVIEESLAVGDCLMIPNVGAYGITASLVFFLTKPPAYEIVLCGEKFKEIYQLRHGHEKKGVSMA